MCKMTNKCLFTSGIGLQLLVYYCATNLAELSIINGNERGGPIKSINEVPLKQALAAAPGSRFMNVFLDNLTGDYYVFDERTNEWRPTGNVGVHYSRAMSSLGGNVAGDLVKKVQTHQAKVTDMKASLFFSKLTDVKCTIKK